MCDHQLRYYIDYSSRRYTFSSIFFSIKFFILFYFFLLLLILGYQGVILRKPTFPHICILFDLILAADRCLLYFTLMKQFK